MWFNDNLGKRISSISCMYSYETYSITINSIHQNSILFNLKMNSIYNDNVKKILLIYEFRISTIRILLISMSFLSVWFVSMSKSVWVCWCVSTDTSYIHVCEWFFYISINMIKNCSIELRLNEWKVECTRRAHALAHKHGIGSDQFTQ